MNVSVSEIIALLNRAAAGMETPDDLAEHEREYLVEDLTGMAALLENHQIDHIPC
jgi:hypothetical protein